jgi:hypothetical protein
MTNVYLQQATWLEANFIKNDWRKYHHYEFSKYGVLILYSWDVL